MKIKGIFSASFFLFVSGLVQAQTALPQMQFKGAFASGHKEFNIYKMYDEIEDVLCYIMMPTNASKRDNDIGQIIYDGNSIGALSCFKIFAPPVKPNLGSVKRK